MRTATFTLTTIGDDEPKQIEVDVTYSYIPAEKPEWETGYLGCSETAEIGHVLDSQTGENLDHLMEDEDLAEKIVCGCLKDYEAESEHSIENQAHASSCL